MNDVISIWVDGGCRGNGKEKNVGGWGAVMKYRDSTKEIYGGEKQTTNNVQELTGAIEALKSLKTKSIPVRIHCDSAYVVNGMNEWVKGWKKKGWKKADKKPILNLEKWKELDALSESFDDIEWLKVKGHSTDVGNNRADELANQAMDLEESE